MSRTKSAVFTPYLADFVEDFGQIAISVSSLSSTTSTTTGTALLLRWESPLLLLMACSEDVGGLSRRARRFEVRERAGRRQQQREVLRNFLSSAPGLAPLEKNP